MCWHVTIYLVHDFMGVSNCWNGYIWNGCKELIITRQVSAVVSSEIISFSTVLILSVCDLAKFDCIHWCPGTLYFVYDLIVIFVTLSINIRIGRLCM